MHTLSTDLSFSYADLDTVTCAFVQQKTNECQTLLKRSAQDIIALGNNLLSVKACLPYSAFLSWLRTECLLTERSARRFMHVARCFDACADWLEGFPPTVLYELAAPSTSEAIIKQVVQRHIAPTLAAIRAAKRAEYQPQHAQTLAPQTQHSASTQTRFSLTLPLSSSSMLNNLIQEEMKRSREHTSGPEVPPLEPSATRAREIEPKRDEAFIPREAAAVNKTTLPTHQNQRDFQCWQQAISALTEHLDQCLSQWPLLQEKQTVGVVDWVQLWSVQRLAYQVLERCFQWTQSMALDGLASAPLREN